MSTNQKLLDALVRAEMRFDLIAQYGLPGDSHVVNFACVKDIAAEARQEVRETLDAARRKIKP